MKKFIFLVIPLLCSPVFAEDATPAKDPVATPAKVEQPVKTLKAEGPTTININCQKECNKPKAKPQSKPKPKPQPKSQPQKCPTVTCVCPEKTCPNKEPEKEKEIVYVDRTVYQPHTLSLLLGKGPGAFYPVLEKRSDAQEYKYYKDQGYLIGVMYQYQFLENWTAGAGYQSNDSWFITGGVRWGSASYK